MDSKGKFYLGRNYDLKKDAITEEPLLYDPDDLTTHGVVFGMTGSGKTGLCIGLLEEAALNNIPALLIDPKGDITNALLHFPDLLPDDFEPWINQDEARRDDKSPAEMAEKTATLWKNGLSEWGIDSSRIKELKDSAEFAIFTPGSDAGIPISILASLKAPSISWKKHREINLERISSTATAILGLVGFEDIDPVKSKEHILLANIFEHAWSQGNDLELSDLILQVQNPPIKKLGVFDIDTFFAPKDRSKLALQLNNILAAPSFQSWLEGQALDIQDLLYTSSGKIRHSVFTLSHLSDSERMFFVTLLYSAIETWMRTQSGTQSLRALIYFDEIHGYLPPVAEPPSKAPMLRMLKQARAFGVGQLLATQNPVDVDYKGLSNAGTWFIGKLQADRDKDRLLDGLEGAAQGSFKRADYDKLISKLNKRVFLLHNVHEKKPAIFHTRWVMNYLAGPLTRAQIPALNKLVGAKWSSAKKSTSKSQSKKSKEPSPMSESLSSKPTIASGFQEVFMPASLNLDSSANTSRRTLPAGTKSDGLQYRPALYAQADIRYIKRTYDLDYEQKLSALVEDVTEGEIRFEEFQVDAIDARDFDRGPEPKASFESMASSIGTAKAAAALEKQFADWIYRGTEVEVWENKTLKLFGAPDLSEADFLKLSEKAADEKRDAEVGKAKLANDKKLKALKKRLNREMRELEEDKSEVGQRRMEEMGTHLDNVIGLFGGRSRRLSTSLTKRRMTSKAQADVKESEQAIAEMGEELQDLTELIQEQLQEIDDRWDAVATEISHIPVKPLKKDIFVSQFAIAWLPFHRVDMDGREVLLPAYKIS
jgi:hypothetical protein